MAMLLFGDDGTEFELGLIEDRLEDTQDDFGDDTALTLSFRVATPNEQWEETAPCINTFELTNLAEWLEGICRNQPEMPELELLDPELKFSIVGDRGSSVTIRIDFHLADRPEEYGVDAPTDVDHVDIKLDRAQVRAAVAQLRSDLHDLNLNHKDDLKDEADMGQIQAPAEDLNMIDEIMDHPPNAGSGEDNAGNR